MPTGLMNLSNDEALERELLNTREPVVDGLPPTTSEDFCTDTFDGTASNWTQEVPGFGRRLDAVS